MGEDSNKLAKKRTEKAEDRTEYAFDRTLLANERTFAGWCRTSLACIGVGLGFQAIFKTVEPTWVAKTIASLIIMVGIYIIWQAERRATSLPKRNKGREVTLMEPSNYFVLAVAISIAAGMLVMAIWFLI